VNVPNHILAHIKAHPLPFKLDIFDDNVAVVGMQGSGKTHDAKVLVERFIAAGERTLIVDPTDAWYGLRSFHTGRDKGFDIPIFGGEHGDVPITARSAELIARHFANGNRCAIVSTAAFKHRAEGRRFVASLLETLYAENRAHCRLVVDEADEFAPQNPLTQAEIDSLSAFDRIVRRGRIRGFRVVMITQRTTVINKNLLSQAGAVLAHRLTGTSDRKAVEEWVKNQADVETAKELLTSLPSLEKGTAWVWAPQSKVLVLQKFPPIATYDSSATPKKGQRVARKPRVWSEADLGEIKAALEPPAPVAAVVAAAPAPAPAKPKTKKELAAEAKAFEARVDAAVLERIRLYRSGVEKLVKALAEPAQAFIRSVKHAIVQTEEDFEALKKLRAKMEKHEKIVEGDAQTFDRALSSTLQLIRKGNEKVIGGEEAKALLVRLPGAQPIIVEPGSGRVTPLIPNLGGPSHVPSPSAGVGIPSNTSGVQHVERAIRHDPYGPLANRARRALAVMENILNATDLDKLHIVTAPHWALTKKALEVVNCPTDLEHANGIAARMLTLMHQGVGSQTGIGLAANQVGLLLRIVVAQVPGHKRAWREEPYSATKGPLVIFNPRITHRSPDWSDRPESCLSHPGVSVTVRRALSVTVEAIGPDGRPVVMRTTGLLARVLQHEIDHLDGISIVDKFSQTAAPRQGVLNGK